MTTVPTPASCSFEWSGYPHAGCAEFSEPDEYTCSDLATIALVFAENKSVMPCSHMLDDDGNPSKECPFGSEQCTTTQLFCAEHAQLIVSEPSDEWTKLVGTYTLSNLAELRSEALEHAQLDAEMIEAQARTIERVQMTQRMLRQQLSDARKRSQSLAEESHRLAVELHRSKLQQNADDA